MSGTNAKTVEKSTRELLEQSLPKAIDYEDYKKLVAQLASEGRTTGPEQKESLINYTQLNDRRMKRWDKTFKIPENTKSFIQKFPKKVIWLVLTESWCGDAAPTMPVMDKIAELNPNISLRVLLRDEHTELMERFLTNNAKSIPKLIALDEATLEVLGEWGPRPSTATKMASDYKEVHGILSPQFKQDLQIWYNKDKGKNTLEDLLGLLALK